MKAIPVRATGGPRFSNCANYQILFPMAERRSSGFTRPA